MIKLFKKICDVVCGAHQIRIIRSALYVFIMACVLLSPLNGGLLILAVFGCVGMAFLTSDEKDENE